MEGPTGSASILLTTVFSLFPLADKALPFSEIIILFFFSSLCVCMLVVSFISCSSGRRFSDLAFLFVISPSFDGNGFYPTSLLSFIDNYEGILFSLSPLLYYSYGLLRHPVNSPTNSMASVLPVNRPIPSIQAFALLTLPVAFYNSPHLSADSAIMDLL